MERGIFPAQARAASRGAGGKGYPGWTSLNFFNPQPEPLLLDERLATTVVLEQYETVAPPYRLGDVLIFLDNVHGNAFHTCVYVAADVVVTKIGRNFLSPWVFQTLDHVKKTYLFENNGYIVGYRARNAALR